MSLLPHSALCAGVNSPELIGQLVEVLPQLPVDVDFPYSCSPGLLGSSGGSTTAMCNGLVMPQSACGTIPCCVRCSWLHVCLLDGSAQPVPSARNGRSPLSSVHPATYVRPGRPYQRHVRPARIQASSASRVRRNARLVLAGANAGLALPHHVGTQCRSDPRRGLLRRDHAHTGEGAGAAPDLLPRRL